MRCGKLLLLLFFLLADLPFAAQAGGKMIFGKCQFHFNGRWYDAQLPFSIHTDLLNNKLIEDPFYSDNESRQQWIGQRDWEYKNTFDVVDAEFSKWNLELVFTGLDTYSDVYLNDSLVLSADNMFREWRVECKKLLKKNGNVLRLVFHSAEKRAKELYGKYPYPLPGEERVMVRKAQFHFGWDWAPRFITCGLQNVTLEGWDDYRIAGVRVQLKHLDSVHAQCLAIVEIPSRVIAPVTVIVVDKKSKRKMAEAKATLVAGTNLVHVEFTVQEPRRWWCNGSGYPSLYELSIEVKSENHSGRKDVQTGLRTIRLVNEIDSAGKSFSFELNGLPVFMKGANYVPQDVFLNRVSKEKYSALLRAVKDAGMNMIRVWGGGVYQSEAFYDLCDEYGILVWHDFMFAGGMYPFDSVYLENVKKETEYQVSRLSNHPCMALWCGNNESSEGWHRWGWQDDLDSLQREAIWNGYKKLFHEILPAAVRGFSQTNYRESSPEFGRGDVRHTSEGDAHNWFVWHDGEAFENYEQKIPRFMSEFGFQSLPDLATLQMVMPDSSLSITSLAMKAHQKHSRGFTIINDYMKRQYDTVPGQLSDYIILSQKLQAEGMVKGARAHLGAKPYCMGSLLWQLNDCWPSVSWSMIDYYGRKKTVYDSVKKLFLNK